VGLITWLVYRYHDVKCINSKNCFRDRTVLDPDGYITFGGIYLGIVSGCMYGTC